MSSDRAVQEGIVIPLAGIENYPYTIIFTLSGETPELLKPESRLQHQRGGYVLRIENRQLRLFTREFCKTSPMRKSARLRSVIASQATAN